MPRSAARSKQVSQLTGEGRVRTALCSEAGHRFAASGASSHLADHRVLLGAGQQPGVPVRRARQRRVGATEGVRRKMSAQPGSDMVDRPVLTRASPILASIRSRSAAAARRPNVSTRMWSGSTPSATLSDHRLDQRGRLAGARATEHQQRPGLVRHDGLLVRGERHRRDVHPGRPDQPITGKGGTRPR
jgi:hypothetical protein